MKLWYLEMIACDHNKEYMRDCHNYSDGHYIIAKDEAQARLMAYDTNMPNVWDNPNHSTCVAINMRKAQYLTSDYQVH